MVLPALIDPTEAHAALDAIEQRACTLLRGRPPLSLREWSEKNRRLGRDESALPGRYRVDVTPYLSEIMEALDDPYVEEVVVVKPSQSAATAGLIMNKIGYHIHQDPAPILIILPTLDEGEKWSKTKLTPMLRNTPCLRGKVSDPKARSGDNSVLEKEYPGGRMGIVGSVSARGFRMVSVRFIAGDDVDGWAPAAGTEGDQITLAKRRADRDPDRKYLWVSTPTDEVTGRIHKLYAQTERRGEYHVPCPHCEHMHVLRWGGPNEPGGLKWDKQIVCADCKTTLEPDEQCECGSGRRKIKHLPDTAYAVCPECGGIIEEHHRRDMALRGRYLTEDGEPVLRGRPKSVGFWFSGLDVILPGSEFARIAAEYLKLKAAGDLKAFYITVLARVWTETRSKVEAKGLEARASLYTAADGNRIEVPDGVGKLYAFIDVQHDRVEINIRGFGAREVSWQIAHHRIYGDTQRADIYKEIDGWIFRAYRHANGGELYISATGVDSGDGTRTAQVYDYVRPRQLRGVWATKGSNNPRMREPVRVSSNKSKRTGVRPVLINTHSMKSLMLHRVALQARAGEPPPDGFYYFRAAESAWHNGCDAEFFTQLTREVPRRVRTKQGYWVTEWVATGPNEAVDLEAGCLAMLRLDEDNHRGTIARLGEYAERARQAPGPQPDGTEEEEVPASRGEQFNPWAYGWR